MKIQDRISAVLTKIVTELLKEKNIKQSDVVCEIEIPQTKEFGDFSTNIAMRSCKLFGKAPMQVGEIIKQKLLESDEAVDLFQDIVVVKPGFINFFIKPEILFSSLNEILKQGTSFGKSDMGKGKKVNIEFVSANPTGPLHVGHGRGAVIGDVLANLYEFVGYEVTREYYLNDCGRQIDILGRTVKAWSKALEKGGEPDFTQEEGEELSWYKGLYMKDVTLEVIKRYGVHHEIRELGVFAGNVILEIIKNDLK
ncbi:arginine--tRNA ligase, partial [bacterium]|nr:arginine--tRNA ligase [bacterium]